MNRDVLMYGYKLGSRIVALESCEKYSAELLRAAIRLNVVAAPHSISSPTTWRIHRRELVCLVSLEVET